MAVQKLPGVTSKEASLVDLCSMEAQLVPNFQVPILNFKFFVLMQYNQPECHFIIDVS